MDSIVRAVVVYVVLLLIFFPVLSNGLPNLLYAR